MGLEVDVPSKEGHEMGHPVSHRRALYARTSVVPPSAETIDYTVCSNSSLSEITPAQGYLQLYRKSMTATVMSRLRPPDKRPQGVPIPLVFNTWCGTWEKCLHRSNLWTVGQAGFCVGNFIV